MAPFDAQSFFACDLVDLGDVLTEDYRGVLSPEPEASRPKVGITAQFLENAESYHEKYLNFAGSESILRAALLRAGGPSFGRVVLDLGSGSGNSVIPALSLLPDCRIIATDLSPDLLAILRRELTMRGNEFADRVASVCMDAMSDYVVPDSIDLVIGASILHHLMDPSKALQAAARMLKPEGAAIFSEPFENGSAILRIAYTQILETKGPEHPLPPDVAHVLRAMNTDFAARTGSSKTEWHLSLDDKWLFTKEYLNREARAAGFSEIIIYPLNDVETPFTTPTRRFLLLAGGLQPESMPDWAWDILSYYDSLFSTELKADLLTEGCIILKR